MEQMQVAEAREYQLAAASLKKRDKRQAASFSKGSTTGAMALSGRQLPRLTEYLTEKWKTYCRADAPEFNLERMLRQLEPEVVALVCLQSGMHVVATQPKKQVKAFRLFADNLEAECFSAGLTVENQRLAKRAAKWATEKHSNQKMRQAAARAVAKKAGFSREEWSDEDRIIAGTWCANLLTQGLPDVFHWEEFTEWNKSLGIPEKYRVLTVSEEAHGFMAEAIKDMILRRPVWLPRLTPPAPWVSYKQRPSDDTRVRQSVALIKAHNNDQIAEIKKAIADGTMAPALKGINTLQAVPFQINTWLLDVMDQVQANGLVVPGFTVPDKLEVPAKLTEEQWNALGQDERKLASEERYSAQKLNRQRHSDLTLLALDMAEAHRLAEVPEFYMGMTMDFRGRVYPLPRFNFQRGDHVRSLFLFRNGLPIGEKGTHWLRVHVANCWAQKAPGEDTGLDKKPIAERVQWTKDNEETLRGYVTSPLTNLGWSKADSPFLFLAAARELMTAISEGADHPCHLPVSFDGSCSGLQHMAGATLAEEGRFVNLTDNEVPQDIYAIVAKVARRMVEEDAAGQDEKKRKFAQLFLSYKGGKGIDRKLLKRSTMTFCYSSEANGMGDQFFEDLMTPLQADAVRNKTPHHFGTVKEQAAAARYMGRVAYAAITDVVRKPAEAMDFLKALAGVMAHEGKPVSWVTPAGIPCINRYHETKTKRLSLWLHNERLQVYVATGTEAPLLKRKCQQSIAPNWVHSMDAAHLLLTAGACADEGITDIVTVHDSFGCLPAHAGRFNQIIREQFVLMYQRDDLLTCSRTTASAQLSEANQRRLPPLPTKGQLELSEVLRAKYAFA
jgi:DNA-directed RNA polymerase